MSEKQGSVLGLGHGDNQAVAGTTDLLYAISPSQLVKFQSFYSLNTSKCVSWDIFNSSRNVLKGTGCKAGHLRSCPQELHPPAPHLIKWPLCQEEMNMGMRIHGSCLPGAITGRITQVTDMPVLRLSSPVVTDLWSCSIAGPLGPTDGYIPYRDQRTYDTQNSYSQGFFPPKKSQGACWFEQTECKRKISSWIEFSFKERKLWFVCLLNLIQS